MDDSRLEIVYALLAATLLLGTVGEIYFVVGRDAPRKRQLFRWWNVAICSLFVALPLAGGMSPWALLFWAPAMAATGMLILYAFHFCDNCGAQCRMILSDQVRCRRCGAQVVRPGAAA